MLAPVLRREATAHAEITATTARVLAATLRQASGDPGLVHNLLYEAVQWSAPQQFRRPFLDAWRDVMPLLAVSRGRFGHAEDFVTGLFDHARTSKHAQDQVSPLNSLTVRELELLRDLPSPMSLADIAQAHSISLNTVKTHLSAIYRKFGVNNRHAAAREARRLGIL